MQTPGRFALTCAAVAWLVAGFSPVGAQDAATTQPATTPPAQGADDMHPRVKLETTMGAIVLELDAVKAPISTTNFVKYVQSGHYDGTVFHRVMPTFMIQGGGYTAEIKEKGNLQPPIKNEWKNGLKNNRGTIAMARTSDPDSATAQFFINVVDNGMLDQPRGGAAYAVFGKVVEGMDVVDKIKDTETVESKLRGMGKVEPKTPIVINKATVLTPFDPAKVQAGIDKAAKEAAAAAEKEMADRVAQIEKETGKKFEKAPSGLMWVVIQEGTGAQPKATDKVTVHYTGTFLNGKELDSSRTKGKPATFNLPQLIKGWGEGLTMMKVGERRIFVIPSELAWGARGMAPDIPPNAVVVFDVELFGIGDQPPASGPAGEKK